MTINPRQHLVLIKGEDKTDQVLQVAKEGRHTTVTFSNEEIYRYSARNVEWLSDPVHIPIENVRISISGDMLSDVEQVLRFGSWAKVFHRTGGNRCCPLAALSVQKMGLPDKRSRDILAYFRELAAGASLKTDKDDSLLAMKYRHLDSVSKQSILAGFINGGTAGSKPVPAKSAPFLIFPFGCNMSQKAAVEAALQNPVSLIQGPPGTGKTQTILNLIANLLLQGKDVAVVSNNNSATANVLEKLVKYELDFLAASLGSNENKEAFIQNQNVATVRMPKLQEDEEASIRETIRLLIQGLDRAFATKNELAETIQKIDALRLELIHFERFLDEPEQQDSIARGQWFQLNTSANVLMKYWLKYEQTVVSLRSLNTLPSLKEKPDWITLISFAFQKALYFCAELIGKIQLLLQFGWPGRFFLKLGLSESIRMLQYAYYLRKTQELDGERKRFEASLEGFHFEERLEQLTELSMRILKHHLAGRYNDRARRKFSLDDLWKDPEDFLEEYPVILSTTFSVITSVRSGYLFDCVIVDEASQVDLLNGILAMGCAQRLVIVGDPMQLPNVLTKDDVERAKLVVVRYKLPEYAHFERHNMLSAVRAAFPEVPEILLREHYRCHPKIIEFCNQKFYGGDLLVMTRDLGELDVLKAYVTVEGQHARGTFNQRQIDEIVQNVLPELGSIDPSDIGIVSPYRAQADRMRTTAGSSRIEIDTVHKYQGREKRIMIISTVSNERNDFVDNPNLLNVAISRAQEKLRLVVSKEMAEGSGNVADFVRYIRYQNGEVISGKIRSIFDLLYVDYTEARLQMLKKRKRVSNYDSENLVHGEIEAVLLEDAFRSYGVVSQFPLSMLIQNTEHLTIEESSYALHPWTKTDFLIYRKVDKSPVLVIEVDGHSFHREGTRQAERDVLKNSVLKKSGLSILRLSTVGSNERSLIREKLELTGGEIG